MRIFASVMLLLLFMVAGMTHAAEVDGTWTGLNAGPEGNYALTFNFKVDGTTLTGSSTVGIDRGDGLKAMQRSKGQINGGKIDGSTITFTVTYDFDGTPATIWYKGVAASDQIRISGGSCEMPENWKQVEKGWECGPIGFRFQLPLERRK